MAYARSATVPSSLAFQPAPKTASKTAPQQASAPGRRGLFRRLLDAIERANMRRAEREIARYLGPGAKFTDETERDIERRFLSPR
jgi:hypothetical protein